MKAVWLPIVLLLAIGCSEPEPLPPGPETITPTPPDEQASTPPVTTPTGAADPSTPAESWERPDGARAELAARHFGDRRFRKVVEFSLSGDRRLYVFGATPDEENPQFIVLVGRVGNRLWAERVHYGHEIPHVMRGDDDFGPGLVQVRISSRRPETEPRPRRDPRSRSTRSFPTEETLLFVLNAQGLEQVHRTVTSDNGVASASLRWDAQRQTLTTTIQRRNSPGRERCRRPEPYDIVHTWRAGHFAETHRDEPGQPCGQRPAPP